MSISIGTQKLPLIIEKQQDNTPQCGNYGNFFCQKLREIIVFIKSHCMKRFHEIFSSESKFLVFPHCAQCGNYRNSLSHFFCKNFVKAMVLLKKLLKCWFDEKKFQWERISRYSTLCCVHVSVLKDRTTVLWYVSIVAEKIR